MLRRFLDNCYTSTLGLRIRSLLSSMHGYQQVPQNLFLDFFTLRIRVVLSLFSETVRMTSDTKGRISRTRSFKSSELGLVLLIGNGPSSLSLESSQLARFVDSGGKIAVMNSFFKTELANAIKPDYYFVADPELWQPSHKVNQEFRREFTTYVNEIDKTCWIVQPASQPQIVDNYPHYIYTDPRSIAGLKRIANPTKPWGLPPSVAMIAISSLKYFGHKKIFFTGLDSNMHNYYFVDNKNQLLFDTNGYHSYSYSARQKDRQEPNSPGTQPIINDPVRHMADLLFAQGIFLRDLYWLCEDICVNVGNDETNDAAPRACLIKYPEIS